MLPRAIILSCLIIFTHGQPLSNSENSTAAVPENSEHAAKPKREVEQGHSVTENASEQNASLLARQIDQDHIHWPVDKSEHPENKPKREVDHVHPAPENASEHAVNIHERQADKPEEKSDHPESKPKREVDQADSAPETASAHDAKAHERQIDGDHIHWPGKKDNFPRQKRGVDEANSAPETASEHDAKIQERQIDQDHIHWPGNKDNIPRQKRGVDQTNSAPAIASAHDGKAHRRQIDQDHIHWPGKKDNFPRLKREVDQVKSAAENATGHAAERASANDAPEKVAVNVHVSENPDSVANKDASNADNEKPGVDVSDKSGVDDASHKAGDAAPVNAEAALDPKSDPPISGRRNNPNSKWCLNLKNCQSNKIPICGFDEKAGFAQFEDFCHLMEVNCYWDHDFTLHACKAMYLKKMGRPRDIFN